jgi:hypothetical protein
MHNSGVMRNTNQVEKIYRVWSDGQEDQIAVRLQFTFEDVGDCRVFQLGAREEWA